MKLARSGYETTAAEGLLKEFEQTLLAMQEHYGELLAKNRDATS